MSDWPHRLIKQAKGQMERPTLLDSVAFKLDSFLEIKTESYSNTNPPPHAMSCKTQSDTVVGSKRNDNDKDFKNQTT